MPLWNVKDFGATGRFVPSTGAGTDDTLAILTALAFAATNQQWGTIYFPAGLYQITDKGWGSTPSQNKQAIQISGSGSSFVLTIVTANGTTTPAQTYTTPSITYSGMNSTTAGAIQTTLQGMGAPFTAVAASYDAVNGWIAVTFITASPAYLGAPVITAAGTNLVFTISVLQSGAAIVAPNFTALRLLGDGAGAADYDFPGGTTTMSRSALVWNGTSNGILLHLLGCQDITFENLALWGAPTLGAVNAARTGLLFSSPHGASASPAATRLTCRSAVFTRFGSNLTPSATGCVQLGMNAADIGADATNYDACTFGPAAKSAAGPPMLGNGLLVVNSGSVNHNLHGCSAQNLTNASWFQQGGNLKWDSCRATALGAVLKIGVAATTLTPSSAGGGASSSAFLIRNVRTDPAGGPNVTVVDSTYAAPGTSVTVEGWDDTNSTSTSISFVQSAAQPPSSSPTTNPSVTLTVAGGNTLVAFGSIRGTTLPSQTAVSDNQGNVWVYVPNSGIASSSNAAAAVWYCASAAAGSTTVTFNSGGVSAALVVHEYSGVDSASPVDALAVASGANALPNSGTLTTNYFGEMLLGFTAQGTTNVVYSATGGYTIRNSNNFGSLVEAYASEDLLAGAAGSYTATFSQGGTNANWVCIGLALKPAGTAVAMGAGSSVQVRDSLVSRSNLAEEGVGNPPTSMLTAALRLDNLIVPEGRVGASLCPNLSTNTKVEHTAERTGTYNVVRPDVTTMIGRPRYSPVNWRILQQNPKFFFDLGDIGLVAPNQGWNLVISSTITRSDAEYVQPVTQNVQGIVQSDSIGGFNTRGPGSSTPTGYVSLVNNGPMGLGPVSGKGWTLFAVVQRNAAPAGQTLWVISNLGPTASYGGFELSIDDANVGSPSRVTYTTQDGTNIKTVVGTTAFTTPGVPIYIMIQVDASANVNLYVQGQTTADQQATGGTYLDSTLVPVIGHSGHGSGLADLQIARIATFDFLLPLSVWNGIYNAGTTFQGR